MTKPDEMLRRFFEKYAAEIVLAVLFALSVLIRVMLTPKTAWSGDYLYCIEPWVERYRELGFVDGLATEISNYYIPYNVLLAVISLLPMEPWVIVSIVSCLFEYLMIYYIYRILLLVGGETRSYTAAYVAVFVLYIPIVFMNGAFWKQCDAIYSAFAVMALYYLLSEKYYRAFVFLSIAFVFKLQAVLILPVFLLAYFCGKKFSVFMFLRLPLTYLEAGLPAIICGRPAGEVFSIYLNQSDEYHYMFMNTGNLYRVLRSDYEAASGAAVLCTVAALAFLFIWIYKRRAAVSNKTLLQLAGISGLICFMFLPAMHERYDYLPIVLATSYYAYYDRKRLYVPGVFILVSSVMYSEYLFGGNTLPEEVYALMNLGALIIMLRDLSSGLNKGVLNVDQSK